MRFKFRSASEMFADAHVVGFVAVMRIYRKHLPLILKPIVGTFCGFETLIKFFQAAYASAPPARCCTFPNHKHTVTISHGRRFCGTLQKNPHRIERNNIIRIIRVCPHCTDDYTNKNASSVLIRQVH